MDRLQNKSVEPVFVKSKIREQPQYATGCENLYVYMTNGAVLKLNGPSGSLTVKNDPHFNDGPVWLMKKGLDLYSMQTIVDVVCRYLMSKKKNGHPI